MKLKIKISIERGGPQHFISKKFKVPGGIIVKVLVPADMASKRDGSFQYWQSVWERGRGNRTGHPDKIEISSIVERDKCIVEGKGNATYRLVKIESSN